MNNVAMYSRPVAFAALVGLGATMGCAHAEAKPPVAPTTVLSSASPSKGNVVLSDRLRQACGISTVESVGDAPKFDFDQNAILPADRDVLAVVAQCLTVGPLKGRSVSLVGRADPRGTEEYNMALGGRRSNAVLQYLTGLGVSKAQLSGTSRGALDATGNDETAWSQDRRVDIDVRGGTS